MNINDMFEKIGNALDNEDWETAIKISQEIISYDNRNQYAYQAMLLAEMRVQSMGELKRCKTPLDMCKGYHGAIEYSDEDVRNYLLNVNSTIKQTAQPLQRYHSGVQKPTQTKPVKQFKQKQALSATTSKRNIVIGGIGIVILLLAIIFIAQNIKYKRNLSALIGGLNPKSTVEDVVNFEKSYFFNEDYNKEVLEDRGLTRYEFEEYRDKDGKIKFRHYYFIDTKTERLKSMSFNNIQGDVLGIMNTVNTEYGGWDKTKSSGLFNYLFGNINKYPCEIRFDDGFDEDDIFIHFKSFKLPFVSTKTKDDTKSKNAVNETDYNSYEELINDDYKEYMLSGEELQAYTTKVSNYFFKNHTLDHIYYSGEYNYDTYKSDSLTLSYIIKMKDEKNIYIVPDNKVSQVNDIDNLSDKTMYEYKIVSATKYLWASDPEYLKVIPVWPYGHYGELDGTKYGKYFYQKENFMYVVQFILQDSGNNEVTLWYGVDDFANIFIAFGAEDGQPLHNDERTAFYQNIDVAKEFSVVKSEHDEYYRKTH